MNIDNDENFDTNTIIPNTLMPSITSIMTIVSTASTTSTIPIPLALTTFLASTSTTSLVSAISMVPAISSFTKSTSIESMYVEPIYVESIHNEFTYTESIILVASTSLVSTVIRKDKNFQGIFKQLKTPVDDISEVISSSKDTSIVEKNDTISGLVLLYNKANHNKEHATYANQAEILSWYHYAEEFEKQVKKILNNTRVSINKAKLKVYRELLTYLVDVDLQTLQKRTQRANTVYNLFKKIGVDKI
ncbi:2044_t:CDS:1 [Racocetra persica]|uniref:2044_t:CDS:1 n=1 Tax=Racocetra persica TaxID=160502 RepID=A0ACA9KNP3_9GLOM|nr:2044_t:CDS:1 [Racocetra persica]